MSRRILVILLLSGAMADADVAEGVMVPPVEGAYLGFRPRSHREPLERRNGCRFRVARSDVPDRSPGAGLQLHRDGIRLPGRRPGSGFRGAGGPAAHELPADQPGLRADRISLRPDLARRRSGAVGERHLEPFRRTALATGPTNSPGIGPCSRNSARCRAGSPVSGAASTSTTPGIPSTCLPRTSSCSPGTTSSARNSSPATSANRPS
jgi:hypothetical protein